MPSLVATIPSFIISPATYSSGAYKWASVSQTFTLTGFTKGSTITAAKLCVATDHKGSVRVSKTVSGTEKTVSIYGDHYASSSDYVDIISLFGGKGSELNATSWSCAFEYKAASNSSMHIQGGAAYSTPPALHLTYTLPYTACTAPTSVSAASTNVAPGATVRVSWSGASAGTNNPIASYTVYRSSDNSSWSTLKSGVTNRYLDVTAPSTNGATFYYKVATVGEVSGYNSGKSSAKATIKCSFSAPSVSAVKLNNSASDVYAAAGASVTLSWTGTNGTNNTIQNYIVKNGSTTLATVTGTSYSVTAPTAGTTAAYTVTPVGAYSSGSAVSSPTLYAYGAPSAPTALSLSQTHVGPGVEVTLSWSGAKAGSYNAITGYRIMRSTSEDGTYTQLGNDISSTETSGSVTVTSSSTNNSAYWYKVVTLGTYSNSGQSGAIALNTFWAKPSVFGLTLNNSAENQYRHPLTNVTMMWNLVWNVNNPVTGYEIYCGEDKIGETDRQTYTVTSNETPGAENVYRVKPLGAVEDGDLSDPISLFTFSDPTAPTVSVSSATADADSYVTLSWTGAEDGEYNAITGYCVMRAVSASGIYSRYGNNLDASVSSLLVPAPSTMGNTYYYKVQATGERAYGALSDAVSVTAKVYTVPTAPSTVTVDDDTPDAGTTTTLRWSGASAGTNNPIAGYKVMRATTENGTYEQVGENLLSDAGSLEITAPATMGAYYWYKVYTIGTKSGFTLSQPSAAVCIMAQVYTRCGTPGNVTISASILNPGASVTVTWTAAEDGTNNPVDGYAVYRSTGAGYSLLQTVDDETLTITDMIGASGTTQSYKIVAVGTNTAFNGIESSIVSCKSNTQPETISSFTLPGLVYESGGLTVSWRAPADVDKNIVSYTVQRRIEASAGAWGAWSTIQTVSVTAFSDTPTVTRGLKFQYRVCAVDALGLSGEYAETSVFTRNSVPLAPTILHPSDEDVTYDTKPWLVVSCPADPDNHTLSVMLAADSGTAVKVATVSGNKTVAVEYPTALAAGDHTLSVTLRDSLGADSETDSVEITITTPVYGRTIAAGAVIANGSISHQAEVTQLYQLTNKVLAYYGLETLTVPSAVGSSASGAGAGKIGMFGAWGAQMLALQNALLSVYAQIGVTPPKYTAAKAGMAPTAAIINELRASLAAL